MAVPSDTKWLFGVMLSVVTLTAGLSLAGIARFNELVAVQVRQGEQIVTLQGILRDRVAVVDIRNANSEVRLRAVEIAEAAIVGDVRNLLALQSDQSTTMQQIQTSIATLNIGMALLVQQRSK